MKISTDKKKIVKNTLIILLWLLVWQAVSLIVSNKIVIVGPVEVLIALCKSVVKLDFYKSVGGSLLRIGSGFLVAFALGTVLGGIAYGVPFIKDLLKPFVTALKSVPVASFVVILLIWFGADNLSFYVSMLVVFPIIYINTCEGFGATDDKLKETAEVFGLSFKDKLIYVYRDSVMPYIKSAVKTSFGMAWKSGVAAEVIGLPDYSLGAGIYRAKIYLETADLFAWTVAVILLSIICELTVLVLLHLSDRIRVCPKGSGNKIDKNPANIKLENITAGYGDFRVIDNMSLDLTPGICYEIHGASGVGKTTLLKEIYRRSDVTKSVMFQENRLLEEYDGLTNVVLCARGYTKEECKKIALRILPEEFLNKPVKTYSGGMKRRVALLRALCHDSDMFLLDEPFTGLDDETKEKATELITDMCRDSVLCLVTHEACGIKTEQIILEKR